MRVTRTRYVIPLCVAMWAAAAIGAIAWPGPDASADRLRDAPAPALTLDIRLTVANDLPPTVRKTLVEEAEDIWRREGVRVTWISPIGPHVATGPVLRVLVIRMLDRPAEDEAWPVGSLLPEQHGERLAIASITAAQRVVASAGYRLEPPERAARRLGLVLGRAVAHEIGHYLLGARSHTRLGLMRARIDARDFADLREGAFFLDAAGSRQIRALSTSVVAASVTLPRGPQ